MTDEDTNDIDLDEISLDLSDAEEQRFVPLPNGTYNATLVGGKVVKAQTSGKPMISWTWDIDGHNRKVWANNMLDFNNKEMSKGQNPKPKGRIFKDSLFNMLLALCTPEGDPIFDANELRANLNIADVLEQAAGAKANLKLEVDTEYDNNKIRRIKRFDPSTVDADDEMPV